MPLTVTRHTDSILRDITLRIETGAHLLIMGANGAGKTTLARTIAGLRPSDAVSVDGITPYRTYGAARAARIYYVPPKLEVFDAYMRVHEFLALSHMNDALSVDEALRLCDIAALRDKTCASLSSGEGQLVLFASALLHNARYTIFDEPAANLDPVRLRRIFHLLRDTPYLQSRIVITHHLDMAYKLGYDICYLRKGRIDFFAPEALEARFEGSVGIDGGHAAVRL